MALDSDYVPNIDAATHSEHDVHESKPTRVLRSRIETNRASILNGNLVTSNNNSDGAPGETQTQQGKNVLCTNRLKNRYGFGKRAIVPNLSGRETTKVIERQMLESRGVVRPSASTSSVNMAVIDSVISGTADSVRRQEERFKWTATEKQVLLNGIKMFNLDYEKLHETLPEKSIGEIKLFLEQLVSSYRMNIGSYRVNLAELEKGSHSEVITVTGRPRRVVVHDADGKSLADCESPIEKWSHIVRKTLGNRINYSDLLVDVFKGFADQGRVVHGYQKITVKSGSATKTHTFNVGLVYDFLQNLLSGNTTSLPPCESHVVLKLFERLSNEIKALDLSSQTEYLRSVAVDFASREMKGWPLARPEDNAGQSNDVNSAEGQFKPDVFSLNPLDIPIPMLEPARVDLSPRKKRRRT